MPHQNIDKFFKLAAILFGQMFVDAFDLNYHVLRLYRNELISLKGGSMFTDLVFETREGILLNFEFQDNKIGEEHLKRYMDYKVAIQCQSGKKVVTVIICTYHIKSRVYVSEETETSILRPIIRSSSWTGPAEPRQQRASAMTFHSIYAIRTDRLKSSQAVRSASVLSKNRKKQTEPHRRDSRPAKKDHCTWPASQRMSVMYSGLSFYGDRSLCGHRDNKPFHIVPGDCIGSRWLCDRPLCRIVDLEGPGVPFDDKG